MKADWSSSAAACPSNPSGGEHLVPVVADPAAGPAVPAAAGQPHRVGVGRAEERLGRGRAPVDEQPTTGAVGEAEPADVHGLGVVRADHVARGTGPGRSDAGRAGERSAGAPPGRGPAPAWPVPPGALRAASRRSDRSAIDCSRLSAMAAKCRSSSAISAGSALAARRSGRSNAVVRSGFTSAISEARPGPCRKAPGALYVENGEGEPSPFSCRPSVGRVTS